MFDILAGFLRTEIADVNTSEHQEMYIAIRYFLTSYEIREGKFEANEYLINKINRETVIIYQEYETPDGWKYSRDAQICIISELLKKIDDVANKNGLTVPVD